ncbi:Cell-division control histidine kinase PdhS [compost metagenome]
MFSAFVFCSLLATFAICSGIGAYIWSSRRSLPHRLLLLTQICYALWAFLVLAALNTESFELKIYLTKARQLFLPVVAPTWLYLVTRIFFRAWWEKWKGYLALIYVFPVIAILGNLASILDLSFAKEWVFYDFVASPVQPGLLRYKNGWLISSLFSYGYLCCLVIYGIYLYVGIAWKGLKRKYAIWMAMASLVHMGFEIFGRIVLKNSEMVQLSIASVWPMAVVLYYVVSRLDFMDIRSLAQQQVFESLPSPVLVLTSRRVLWDANSVAFEVLGLKRSHLGLDIQELTHLGEILESDDARVQGRRYQVSKHLIHLQGGEDHAFVYVLNDVSDIKRLNDDLEESNQILKELNARILSATKFNQKIQTVLSHDLSGALSGVSLLLKGVKTQADQRGDAVLASSLGKATEASHASLDLLRDILAWSRHEETDREVCVQSALKKVRSQLLPQISEKGIEIEETGQDSVYILGSSKLLESVLRNLLSNAIRYSHPQGKVLISCAMMEQFVVIKIQDEGLGMSSSEVAAILQRHHESPAPKEGFGLGLSFTLDFVEQLRGQVKLESQPGQGTCFTVFLPRGNGLG